MPFLPFLHQSLLGNKAVLQWAMLLWILLVSIGGIAQIEQYQFDQDILFDQTNGLPANQVWSMEKGKNGFLWLGLANGFCRFDGSKFKVYRHDPEDPHSIIDNRILQIHATKDKIWVGTALGVSILDLKTDRFVNYQIGPEGKTDSLPFERASEIAALFKDRQGNMWVGLRYAGVFKYDPVKDDFIPFPYKGKIDMALFPDQEGVKYVKSFVQSPDNDSLIWAGTNTGLLEINQFSGTVQLHTFPVEDELERKQFNIFRRMYLHDNGLIYNAAWSPNLRVFDPKTKQQQHLIPTERTAHERILRKGAGSIVRKNNHELWITSALGLAVYDTDLNKYTFSRENDFKDAQFYGVHLVDEDGRLWWRSKKGLHFIDPFLQQYQSYSYEDLNNENWGLAFELVQHSNDQTITVFPSDADGLFHLNKSTESWTKTPFPPVPTPEPKYKPTRLMAKAPDGNLTLASQYGLHTYVVSKDQLAVFPFQPELIYNDIREIFWDSRGVFWVFTDNDGAIKWNPETGKSKNYKDQLEISDTTDVVKLYRGVFEDSRDNLWIRRNEGMSVYVQEKDTMLNFLYHLQAEKSFTIHFTFAEDRFGRVWTTSEENWIGYMDVRHPERGIIKKYNLDQYNFPGLILEAVSDLEGDLWFTTTETLLHFDVEAFTFTPHSHDYGQKGSEAFSINMLPSGELAIGERNYITLTDPKKLRLNEDLPIPYLTEIKVLNEPFPLDSSILYLKQLQLGPNENFFSISFSALSFRLGDQNQFQYRLKGFEDWADAGGRDFANYTNVPGGAYVFQLKAANNEGIWNEDIHELVIHIATPWYASWWFRLLVLFLIGAIIFSIYQYQLFQVKQRERLKTAFNKKLANVEMTALLAQMNPHFLFNCLNSIDSYILKNKSREASEYLNNFARLIRLILQNSRSNYISLKDELEALELYIEMESLRLKDKFHYQIKVDKSIDPNSIDIPPMLIQPYVENAIWHGLMNKENKKEGRLTIALSRHNGTLRCIVEDNGVGRQKARILKQNRISTKNKSMGMTITKDRLDLINQLYNLGANVKVIDLVNQYNEAAGTQVILEIPV